MENGKTGINKLVGNGIFGKYKQVEYELRHEGTNESKVIMETR